MDRERIGKPMSEKIVALTPRQKITAAILSGVLGVSACIPQKKSGYVEAAPTPLSPPATEIVPNPYLTPEVHQEELSIFGGFLIGESGIGKITFLDLQENPDPITVQEVTARFIESKPDIKAENVQVYVYDMAGEKGYAPFIMAAEKDGDKIKRAFVGFWVDDKGIQRPPYGGEVYVFYPLGIYKQADGSELIGATTKDGDQLYLPALFIKKGDSLVFIPPYTDSLNTQVSPAERVKEVFDQNISYKVATAIAVPQTPTETPTPEASEEGVLVEVGNVEVGGVGEFKLVIPLDGRLIEGFKDPNQMGWGQTKDGKWVMYDKSIGLAVETLSEEYIKKLNIFPGYHDTGKHTIKTINNITFNDIRSYLAKGFLIDFVGSEETKIVVNDEGETYPFGVIKVFVPRGKSGVILEALVYMDDSYDSESVFNGLEFAQAGDNPRISVKKMLEILKTGDLLVIGINHIGDFLQVFPPKPEKMNDDLYRRYTLYRINNTMLAEQAEKLFSAGIDKTIMVGPAQGINLFPFP